jgi:hypothetical protein
MNKRFFVAALAFFVLTSISALRVNAQSCPVEAFGVRSPTSVDKTLQSQIEVTYFTTNDPNAFISEKGGIRSSASYVSLNSNEFTAKLEALERNGVASVRKQQSATSYLGEMAELNLERSFSNAAMVKANLSSSNSKDLYGLDRKTEVNVYEGQPNDREHYRVSLLSWFVDAAAHGGQRVVDYDAIVLLKPGQTAIFKLSSSYEVKRSGAARSYIAVTMRSVNNVSLASLGRLPRSKNASR